MIVVGLAIAITVLFLIEAVVVRGSVRAIRIRVHVNGTRGKSSVTQYVAAALRASGRTTLAKITGVRPTIILPDGHRRIINRRGRARVQEQFTTLRLAARLSCDAIVLECMSLDPRLQNLETRFLLPTIYVITNILDDHREEIGSTTEERVAVFGSALPRNAILVMGEQRGLLPLRAAALQRNNSVVTPSELQETVERLLPEGVIAANVALALAVCNELGIDSDSALKAILDEVAQQHSGVINLFPEKKVRFINGFAVNDVPSAITFLDHWKHRLGGWSDLVIILNTRNDRPLRSVEFARWCPTLTGLSRVVLTGTHAGFTRRLLLREGMEHAKVCMWGKEQLANPQQHLAGLTGKKTAVVGLGNIAGDGFTIVERLAKA